MRLELDPFNYCEWSSAKDGERYTNLVDKEQIFDVLVRFNKEQDNIQGQLLRITETKAHIRQLGPSCTQSPSP